MNTESLNQQAHQAWEAKAEFWDNLHGDEGNNFHRHLVSPSAHQLLNIQAGEKVLDLGCGNGVFSRELVAKGADVIATDFSINLIEHAKARGGNIDYRVMDATNVEQMQSLGENSFDAVVCNMALMDIADIDAVAQSVAHIMKPNGRFVFTMMHPCFNSPSIKFTLERDDSTGEIVDTYALKVTEYTGVGAIQSVGAIGEPTGHTVFHRTISELINTMLNVNMVMNGIHEPIFPEGLSNDQPVSWYTIPSIPPVLACRFISMPI